MAPFWQFLFALFSATGTIIQIIQILLPRQQVEGTVKPMASIVSISKRKLVSLLIFASASFAFSGWGLYTTIFGRITSFFSSWGTRPPNMVYAIVNTSGIVTEAQSYYLVLISRITDNTIDTGMDPHIQKSAPFAIAGDRKS